MVVFVDGIASAIWRVPREIPIPNHALLRCNEARVTIFSGTCAALVSLR